MVLFSDVLGVIPESLGGLVSLQTIHLSHNQLTGTYYPKRLLFFLSSVLLESHAWYRHYC